MSAQVLNLDALPGKLAIVGGGYIALEFAGIYNNFGSEVHVLWRQARTPRIRDGRFLDPSYSQGIMALVYGHSELGMHGLKPDKD